MKNKTNEKPVDEAVINRLEELTAKLLAALPESVANIMSTEMNKVEQTVTVTPMLTLTPANEKLVVEKATQLGALTVNTEKGMRWQFTANSKPKDVNKPRKKAAPTPVEKEANAQLDVPQKPTEEQVIAKAEAVLGGDDMSTIIRQNNSIINALGDICEDLAAIRTALENLSIPQGVRQSIQRAAVPMGQHPASQPQRMITPDGPDRYRTIEDVEGELQAAVPDSVPELMFDVGQNDILVKPKGWLGREVWQTINEVVRGLGGAYVKVDPKNTYWRVPKDKTQKFAPTQPAGQSNYPNREGGRSPVDANKPKTTDEQGIVWTATTTSKGKPSETAYDADNAGNAAYEELKSWVQDKVQGGSRAVAHGKFYWLDNYKGGVAKVDAAPPRQRSGGGGYGGGGFSYRARY